MESFVPIAAGILAAVILLYVAVEYLRSRLRYRKHPIPPTETEAASLEESPKRSPFDLEEAPEGAAGKFAVIDFQTTGLTLEEGAEDKIIQAAWLLLDEDFRVLSRRLSLVRQTEASGVEAEQIHHIPYEKILRYGLPEETVLEDLWQEITGEVVLVFHNASFDLGIWHAALSRLAPEQASDLEEKETFCTMTFFPELSAGDREEKYLTLGALTCRLTGEEPANPAYSRGLTAWRNVCLTRVCLRELFRQYPEEAEAHIAHAKEFLR